MLDVPDRLVDQRRDMVVVQRVNDSAALSLAVFAWLLTLHPTGAGRTYAAYGGVSTGGAAFDAVAGGGRSRVGGTTSGDRSR